METEKNLKKNIIDIAIVVIISLEKYMEKMNKPQDLQQYCSR